MSSRREILIELLLARGTSAPRERLQRESTDALEEALSKSLLAGIHRDVLSSPEVIRRQQEIDAISAERLWDRFFFNHPEIRATVANRKMIYDYALSLSDDGVVRFENLNEAAKTLPGLDRQKVKQIPTASNLKQDEEALRQFCRTNQLEPNTAALNLLRQQFGAGFDSAQINQALQSGLIRLGPASTEILQEAAEQRQDFLINQASPLELRAAARQESEQRRIQAQQQHVAQQVQIREKAEASFGYPVLPEANSDGVKLDALFFKRLANTDIKKYRQFCNHYGFAAITARLNGVR